MAAFLDKLLELLKGVQIKEEVITATLNTWWRESNSFNIFITGKTGTGKSSLVNAILGKEVAKVGETLDPETSGVCKYDSMMNGIEVTVWDSPGLQDGLKKEEEYLDDIERNCKCVDLFLYCIDMTTDRFVSGGCDIASMCMLTNKLGCEVWNNAVIILSCANQYIVKKKSHDPKCEIEKAFENKLEMWKNEIAEKLSEHLKLKNETIEQIPIVPAGKRGKPLLFRNRTPWLNALWMKSLGATKKNSQPAFLKLNVERLKRKSDIKSEEEYQDLLKKEHIIISEMAQIWGEKLNVKEAGYAVGEKSGIMATAAHSLERKQCLKEDILDAVVTFPEGVMGTPCIKALSYANINY